MPPGSDRKPRDAVARGGIRPLLRNLIRSTAWVSCAATWSSRERRRRTGSGYEVMVVRGCTTGMESRETQPALSQTRGEILFLERFGQSSDASDEIIAGLPRARTPWGTASR